MDQPTTDPKMLLARCVAEWTAAGWIAESHSDYTAVMVQQPRTAGQGFMKAGVFGMIWNSHKNAYRRRVTLFADENGVRQL